MAVLIQFSVSGHLFAAQQTDQGGDQEGIEQVETADKETEATEKKQSVILDMIEKEKERVESQNLRAVQWVDSFFSDPAYEAEVATSQFRIRPEVRYRNEQGWGGTVKFSFKFRLPNLERRVSLVGGSSDFDEDFDAAVDEDVNEPAIGLQFFGKEREKWGSSLSVGLKFNEFAGFVGPRFRYNTKWSERSSFRFIQKILWQTNNEWQLRSRFDFNFAVNERFFFRQMFDARWRGEYSDEEGYRTRVSSILTRRLPNSAGLQSEATMIFHTEPDLHVNEYIVALRYRKRVWRDWFYYEIVPQLAWEKEFDYRTNPGIRLRFEVFYGADKNTRFWKREAEDTDDFRW
jgi:hypothetical protein